MFRLYVTLLKIVEFISITFTMYAIWVFHVGPIWRIFCQIIWQIESYTAQNKFRQKLSPVGLNSQPPDHQFHALLTELGRNLLAMSEVSFLLFHAPLHMLEFVYF